MAQSDIVRRVDAGTRIRQDMRTPAGAAKIPAALTRTGIFVYRNPDGSPRRELRPADEVFRADSLASIESAVVTVGHVGTVAPDAWRTVAVGDVRNVRQDRQFVAADLMVRDADTLKRVDAGDLVELSMGYQCRYDATPGSYQGERYDGVQRNIVYDHVALLPSGTGRAGADVRLRLDGVLLDADVLLGAGVPLDMRADGDDDARADGEPRPQGMSEKNAIDLSARLDALTVDFEATRKRVVELEASVVEQTKRAYKA